MADVVDLLRGAAEDPDRVRATLKGVMRDAAREIETLRALSQAGAGGVVDERALDEARKVYNASLLSDGGAFGATERIVKAYLSALAASPSAGEPVAEIVVEDDRWAGGHFYVGRSKTIKHLVFPDELPPVGTKLYATPPAPVQTASMEVVRTVLEEAKFALFCSDMTIKDRADQSIRLMLASLTAPEQEDDERAAMEAVMKNVDPSVWPGLTAAQRCALGRFAKPSAPPHGPDTLGLI